MTTKFKLEEGKDFFEEILNRVENPNATEVTVGVHAEEGSDLVAYASSNEFGT